MSNLIPLEFNNQRIMATKVLAEQFGTEERRITENFNRNSQRFIEGKHYILLQGEELRRFKSDYAKSVSANINKLYLWTDRGASRHAKILDTDEAWDVYEALEENYFNPKNVQTVNTLELSPELQMFKQIFDTVAKNELEQKQMKQDIANTKKEVEDIRDIVALNSTDWKVDSKALIVNIANKLGGNQFIHDVYKEAYSLLERRAACQLKIRKTNKQKKMALEGVCKSKINAVSNLDVIGEDKRLLECFLAIIKELAIKYGVTINN